MAGEMSAIGTGISLQNKGLRFFEGLIGRRMAIDAAGEMGGKKGAAEKLVNLDDFGGNMGDLYPAIATQIKGKLAGYANRYQELVQESGGDTIKARNKWEAEMLPKKTEIAELRAANNAIKDYDLKKSQKTFLTPERDDVMATANNPNATAEDWAKLNNPDNGITATPTFGFSANLTPRVDLLGIIEKHNKNPQPDIANIQTKQATGVGGKSVMAYTIPYLPNENEVNNATNEILTGDAALTNYKRNIRPQLSEADKDPNFDNPDPQQRVAAQRHEIDNFVRKNMAVKQDYKFETYQPPAPTSGQKEAAATTDVQKDIPFATADGGFVNAKLSVAHNTKAPIRIDVTTGTGTINKDGVLQPYKGSSSSLNFEPTGSKYILIKHPDGKESWQWVESGNAIDYKKGDFDVAATKLWADRIKGIKSEMGQQIGINDPKAKEFKPEPSEVLSQMEDAGKLTKTQIITPYRSVRGLLQGKVNTDLVDKHVKAYPESRVEVGSKESGGGSKSIGKTYTRAELKAMSPSYTDDVIDAAVKAGKITLK